MCRLDMCDSYYWTFGPVFFYTIGNFVFTIPWNHVYNLHVALFAFKVNEGILQLVYWIAIDIFLENMRRVKPLFPLFAYTADFSVLVLFCCFPLCYFSLSSFLSLSSPLFLSLSAICHFCSVSLHYSLFLHPPPHLHFCLPRLYYFSESPHNIEVIYLDAGNAWQLNGKSI